MSRAIALMVLVLSVGYSRAAFKLAGEYEAYITGFDYCDDKGTDEIKYDIKLHRKSKTEKVFNGQITFPYGLDDDKKMVLNAAKWGAGGWGLNAINIDMDKPCTGLMQDVPEFITGLMASLGTSMECPVKPGTYEIKDLQPGSYIFTKFPKLPYGKYRIDMVGYKDGEIYGCIRFLAEINEVANSG